MRGVASLMLVIVETFEYLVALSLPNTFGFDVLHIVVLLACLSTNTVTGGWSVQSKHETIPRTVHCLPKRLSWFTLVILYP